MNAKHQHTPTPWRYAPTPQMREEPHYHIFTDPSTFPPVASVWFNALASEGRSIGEAEANAAFIVRACNAHDTLVEGLRAILAQCIGDTWRTSGTFHCEEPANLGEVRRMLAAAAVEALKAAGVLAPGEILALSRGEG